jgi:hypothetical protein
MRTATWCVSVLLLCLAAPECWQRSSSSAAAQSSCSGTVGKREYDISPLSPFKTTITLDSFWEISYQPCTSLFCGPKWTDVAVCQKDRNSIYCTASLQQAKFSAAATDTCT